MRFDEARVLARIDRSSGLDACWPAHGWHKDGYPTYQELGHERRLSHLILRLDGRPVPPGLMALHTCDNPPCCNPRHLYVGDAAQNVADAVTRGRARGAAAGERHHQARLQQDQVDEIRRAYAHGVLQRELAGRFGVAQSTVSSIVNHRRWR